MTSTLVHRTSETFADGLGQQLHKLGEHPGRDTRELPHTGGRLADTTQQ